MKTEQFFMDTIRYPPNALRGWHADYSAPFRRAHHHDASQGNSARGVANRCVDGLLDGPLAVALRRRCHGYAVTVTNKAERSTDNEDDDSDFWLAIPGFGKSLIEADTDYAAGRTFSGDEIRERFGLHPHDARADTDRLRHRVHMMNAHASE
jgi:hypothetical protein